MSLFFHQHNHHLMIHIYKTHPALLACREDSYYIGSIRGGSFQSPSSSVDVFEKIQTCQQRK